MQARRTPISFSLRVLWERVVIGAARRGVLRNSATLSLPFGATLSHKGEGYTARLAQRRTLPHRDRRDRRARAALDLQRLHHEGELVHLFLRELIELHV